LGLLSGTIVICICQLWSMGVISTPHFHPVALKVTEETEEAVARVLGRAGRRWRDPRREARVGLGWPGRTLDACLGFEPLWCLTRGLGPCGREVWGQQ
jgi:hypothetical protein